MNLPEGTVTFLFSDIEGSTRLLEEMGPEDYARALTKHRRLLRDTFAAHGGVEVDTQGDSFFVAFADAAEGARAAAEAQAALAGGPVRVRMALHTGRPLVTSDGYVGMDVHRAARICSTSHGGQVVLSAATREFLDGEDVTDLGLHRLKDLGQPEKLYQLGREKFPPLRSLNATNLPAQLNGLIGRDSDVEELTTLLAHHRLVTVTGPGGTGKTRLTLQVAAESVDVFKDGVFWVPLSSVTNPDLVLPSIAAELGAKVALAEHIGERQMLLLLDNLEQIVEAAPDLSSLLRSCPNLRFLATSRTPLRIEGEVQYRLVPLRVADAVALFRERAAVGEPEATVAEICLQVDCLPLAVELAAARTSLFTPDELLTRLSRRLPLLTSGRRDAPERQRTLRSTIEWSYELLDPEEKRLFRDLAIFAGGFDVRGAEAVADATWDGLQSLVDNSLLRQGASGRLGMLQTIHEFAREELEASGGADDLRRRLTDFLLDLARSANLTTGSKGPQRNDIVQPEMTNFRAALEECARNGEIQRALEMMVSLDLFWVGTLPFEAVSWYERLMARAGELPPHFEAKVFSAWGGVLFMIGRFDEAIALYERCLEISQAVGDEQGVADMLHRLAVPMVLKGETVTARAMNDRALEISERLGDRKGVAVSVGTLADIELAEGNEELGLDLMAKSVGLAEDAGFAWWKAAMLVSLVEHLYNRGRFDEADSRCRESILASHEIGERQWLIFSLGLLARVAAHTGRIELAGTLWGGIEAEEERAPIGQWEMDRSDYAADLARFKGADFERGRNYGRKLTLDEIVRVATQDRNNHEIAT